ncbi:FERM, ARHGEF and pleckstrin domain-containing protein 2 [Sorex fumeus]|uniref:FERM, ARHGEF and pleckstrin domain-containing protein 2 n=1 Tax=Sorex fumeus TaxID=62283 RepID=UPI0024ACAB05|nr:FERM, ARHGEF and pleckstrin domain-containing protein 2 [Sorex fumeus]
MGEIEGTYRALQTPGTRLGAQTMPGVVSTLELGQSLGAPRVSTAASTREKLLPVCVKLLDDTVETFDIEPKSHGQALLTALWTRLNLVESDYFGLEFQNVPSHWIWLEPTKPISRQIRRPRNTVLHLAVKFFPPDPGQLQEEYTRYLFALQLKRDLLEGRLTCADTTAALLTAHLLQAEIGDYDETLDREHLKGHQYLPSQERSLEKVLEFHRKHMGQTPAESDFQVLEIARKLELYGVRLHPAADREGARISLAVSHMGVLVFQSTTKINTFNWSKVRKLSFKRKRFLIKLHPEAHGPHQDTLEFLMGSRDECKNFWKICVEYHTFFRLLDQPKPRAKTAFFGRGSSFRYSGRTQKQLVDYVRDGGVKRVPYERRHSKTRLSVQELPRQAQAHQGTLAIVTMRDRALALVTTCDRALALVTTRDRALALVTTRDRALALVTTRDRALALVTTCDRALALVTTCDRALALVTTRDRALALVTTLDRTTALPEASRTPVASGLFSIPACPLAPAGLPDFKDHGCPPAAERSGAAGRAQPPGAPEPQPGPGVGGGPGFTLAGTPLQVSEEFIDDDPAEISFFAGGSEAFAFPFGSRSGASSRAPALGSRPCSARSSPDRYSTEAVHLDADSCDSEGEHAADSPGLLRGPPSPSDTGSLRNSPSPSPSGSLGRLPLSLSLHTPSSAGQSEASSMANFPACSVRSESSSAFQFSDIVDQLEQLSCPPTAAESPSSSEADSWGSEPEAPLDISLFLGHRFAQPMGERLAAGWLGGGTSVAPGEWSVVSRHHRSDPTDARLLPECCAATAQLAQAAWPEDGSGLFTHRCEGPGMPQTPAAFTPRAPVWDRVSKRHDGEDGQDRLRGEQPRGVPSGSALPVLCCLSPLRDRVAQEGGPRGSGDRLSVDSPWPPSARKSPPSLGPLEQSPSPLLSPGLSDAGGAGTDSGEDEASPKSVTADEALFIAKEILATERTFLKDLEVITVWFRSAVTQEEAMPTELMALLFSNMDPIYEFHRGFLREVEQRLALWEGLSITQETHSHQRIGDVLLRNMRQLKGLTSYFQRHDEVLTELEKATKRFKKLEMVSKEFELQKVCYLPLNSFLLKPLQRLVHYRLLLGRLCGCCPPGHHDSADCQAALKTITDMASSLRPSLERLENLQKLTELQRDLVGVENLVSPGRALIREGSLYKLTKRGLQQRMFFLFSDVLLYTSRGLSGSGHFRTRGLLPLRGTLVEESENEWSIPNCFTICTPQKAIVVAASTELEKEKWTRDLNAAIEAASRSRGDAAPALPGTTGSLPHEPSDALSPEHGPPEAQAQPRANTTAHVCWYRIASVSRADRSAAMENQLSGYLLRKFKNSEGWQKLWVVFTDLCLFFYKTHQDDHPLASLPLLGYRVSVAGAADGIRKEHVFKLQFKGHVYFFRAENTYTFRRWMEVIETASSAPGEAGAPPD